MLYWFKLRRIKPKNGKTPTFLQYIPKVKKNLERSHLLFDEFGIENCLIILVEQYPCNSREELLRKEGEHIKNTECVNKYVAGRTVAEYESENKEQRRANSRASMKKQYERNPDKFIHRAKDYYKSHIEEISQKDKARYEANKDSVLKRMSEKMICECGVTYTHGHRARHQRTQRHHTSYTNNKQNNIILIIMSSSSKDDIIKNIYYDRSWFGSKQGTLSEAREKDKTITMGDINRWFRANVEQKRKPVGQNSFIAPHSAYEYQMDLFFINDLDEQKFRVGVLMIDVFDKFMYVVPIESKQEGDVASGMIECLNKMGKKPEIIYTDDEGALNKEAIQKYLKDENIEHHRTRAHPNFSERAIRTFKDMLYKRVEADEKKNKQNIQWPDYILEVLLTYNNQMKHSATGFTPKEARKPSNQLKVKLSLTMKGKKNRVYPELDVGDEVKIFRKRKPNEKERVSNWSQNIYTIENIENKLGQTYYRVEGNNRQYLRFELLKV